MLGTNYYTGNGNKGRISDFRIYDRVLSKREINTIYNYEGNVTQDYLLLYQQKIASENEKNKIKSCKTILDSGKSIGDGLYTIDVDGIGGKSPFEVYCNMTTDGGGWTRIIKDYTTSITDLAKFGDTSDIGPTFYSDSLFGIGWGSSDSIYKTYLIDIEYSNVKIKFSGKYDNPNGGLGSLSIDNEFTNDLKNILSFSDSWALGTSGQALSIKSNDQYYGLAINEENRNEIINYDNSEELYIRMKGYTNLNYTKRYIGELWVK